MRFTRRLTTLAILVIYAAQLVGAQAIHLGHCTGEASSSCRDNHGAGRTGELACGAGSHADHGGHGDLSHDGHVQHEDGPRDVTPEGPLPHDGARCKLCRVLGQAQQPAAALSLVSTLQVAPASSESAPNFYATPRRSGFQSRAPPVL